MTKLIHPLLLLIAQATEKNLVKMIEYLKTENKILRSKLPKRIEVTPAELAKLVKIGERLGSKIRELISIVSYRTFQRWVKGVADKVKPRKPGRPRKPEEIRNLIVQMARETGWGYRRIFGELKKLRIKVSRSTVARILRENGFDPGPLRGRGTWHEFVKRHIKTLWATDFFTKKVWTLCGPVTYYVLFFIHIQTRRVHIAGMTPNPDGVWMAQQARNLSMFFAEQGEHFPTHIIRDRDSKFTKQFCSILESDGIEFREIPALSPNLNAHLERSHRSIEEECLERMIVFGEMSLRNTVREFLAYYHSERNYQGLENRLIHPGPEVGQATGKIECRERLGGLLRYYYRAVA